MKKTTCISGKKLYETEALAEDALIEARVQFDFAGSRGPIAVYFCEDCGRYHLTSQGHMSEKLRVFLASGQLDKLKQANHWMDKLKYKR